MRISWLKFCRHQWLRGVISLNFSVFLLLLSAVFATFILDYTTYERLTREQPIASLTFHKLGKHHYQAVLTEAHSKPVFFEVYGDQWQLDARIMKWKGVAAWSGLKPLYRLERLAGRYRNIALEKSATRSVHALGQGLEYDLWYFLLDYQDFVPWFDAYYGSATYLPMHHEAKFKITIGNSGLIARPENHAAKKSLQHWKDSPDIL